MDVSCQPHTLAVLLPAKAALVPTDLEDVLVPQLIWLFQKRETGPCQESDDDSPFRVQPSPHTRYTINLVPTRTLNLSSTQHTKFHPFFTILPSLG